MSAQFGWLEFALGFLAGAAATVILVYLQRRRIVRVLTERELSRSRKLVQEGRVDEAAERLREAIREGLLIGEVPQMAVRQLRELYRDSVVGQQVSRVQVLIETYQEERRRLEPGDLRGRMNAILKALDNLPRRDPSE